MAYVTVRHLVGEDRRNMTCIYNEDERIAYTKDALKDNRYERVVDLELGGSLLDILEEAFKLTNSVYNPWYLNKDISTDNKTRKGCRSTSVGDVVQVNGETYMVNAFGFKHIEK